MSADVAGYSRLMGADETGTLAAMRAHRTEFWNPIIEQYGGHVVGTAGDSMLVEFASAVAAVESSVAVQRGMIERNAGLPEERRMLLRIGVNIGEVVMDGDDIFGDGVNVAARLQAVADSGGIAISSNIHEQVSGKIDVTFSDDGEHEVKNINRPVHVWRWSPEGRITVDDTAAADQPLPLPDKPSIAVLPFDNMSGDPEQEYFADGIAEDVITALSRFHSLFVIARNSSFSYRGTSPDIRAVARELGVRYVVEGSVRKAGNRVRVTAQLIYAATGNHLWAERYDGALDDVFDLQDTITERIVVAVEPRIGAHERGQARRKSPDSLDAWELVQRGLSHFYRANEIEHREAIRLFEEAVALDPEFAAAHGHLAYALTSSVFLGFADDPEKMFASAQRAAERAVSLDPNDAVAHSALGRVHIFTGDAETAISEMQAAIAANPNFALGHYGLGWAFSYSAGQPEQALPHLDAALRLDPRDPWLYLAFMVKGTALRQLGRHDEAIAHGRKACQFPGVPYLPYMTLAASLAEAGQSSEAGAAVEKATRLQPALSISYIRRSFVGANEVYLNSLFDGLRKAGVPE
ncbi:MAG: adenylate/guanylate cyclase domain-containing protein [Alphaproteobacteria bacterium]